MSNGQSGPKELSSQQAALYKALIGKNEKLGRIYLGALMVLDQTANPDRLALAGHGLRELMEKIPRVLDVQMSAHGETLKGKVRALEDCWDETVKKSNCHLSGRWEGQIDVHLCRFLGAVKSFLEWLAEHRPRRKREATITLRRLNGSRRDLPSTLETLNVQTWEEMREFFEAVCHHGREDTQEDFGKWVDALERFLLDRLVPRTFADFDTIDRLIEEGETRA